MTEGELLLQKIETYLKLVLKYLRFILFALCALLGITLGGQIGSLIGNILTAVLK